MFRGASSCGVPFAAVAPHRGGGVCGLRECALGAGGACGANEWTSRLFSAFAAGGEVTQFLAFVDS